MAIPTWKMFPALVCGNTVVLKPSEDVPHTAHRLVELALEAGFPPGVINLIHGRGEVAGQALVDHPLVSLVSFTGSTVTGTRIGESCGRLHKRLSLEMGGKNAMIVLEDADLDLALAGVLWGAFGTTGQRCTATSRLLLHRRIHDRFLDRLVDRVARLRLGDGSEPETEVGPLIHAAAREKVERYVEIGRKEGAELVTGGARPKGARFSHGWFYAPTIFAGVKAGSRLEQEEIFGPVLSVVRVGSLDEAIRVNNGVRYGLSSALYTNDTRAAFRACRTWTTGSRTSTPRQLGRRPICRSGASNRRATAIARAAGRSTSSFQRPKWGTWTTRGRCSGRRSTTMNEGRRVPGPRAGCVTPISSSHAPTPRLRLLWGLGKVLEEAPSWWVR